jgi:hypothetical protein
MQLRLPIAAAVALCAALVAPAWAQSPSPSLNDRRLGIIKGDPPAVAPRPAASAASASAAAGGSAAHTAPARAAPQAPPLSGRSLQSARRLESPDLGIALPTAASRAAASAASAATPQR